MALISFEWWDKIWIEADRGQCLVSGQKLGAKFLGQLIRCSSQDRKQMKITVLR
jgi:hypothetical protein